MNYKEMRNKIDQEYIKDLLIDFIKIKSVNPPRNAGEKEAAQFLTGKLKELGVTAETNEIVQERANSIGVLSGANDGSTLVLNGHLDVVPANPEDWDFNPFEPTLKNGKLYGRGSADMKGAIASMIGAVKLIKDENIPFNGKVILSFVCDEESSNLGTLDFLDKYRANYGIIGEPTSLDLAVAHRGVVRFKITTKGKSGHASEPENSVNAIYKMNKIIEAIKDYNKTIREREHNILPSPSCAVTVIKGGQKDNIIPDKCEIVIDRRLIPGEDYSKVKIEIEDLLKRKCEMKDDFYAIEKVTYLEPGELKQKSNFYNSIKCIYENYFEKNNMQVKGFRASCEQSLFLEKGIETVVFGPGSIEQAHQVNEFVKINELSEAAGFYAYSIAKLLNK